MVYNNIVIRFPNWLGDAVIASALLKPLREHFPGSRITVCIKNGLEALFSDNGYIQQVITLKRSDSIFKTIRELKKYHFDCGIILPGSFSSALSFFLAGIPRRVGFSGEGRSVMLTDALKPINKNRHLHIVKEYLGLLERFTGSYCDGLPELYFKDPPLPISLENALFGNATFFGLCTDAVYGPAKQWPKEHFIQLASLLLSNQPDARIVLFGLDTMANKEIEIAVPGTINLAGKTSLPQLAAAVKRCSVLISNDTGLMHFAAALNVPVVGIFGSTNPLWTSPLGKKVRVIYSSYPCSPCYKKTCPIGLPCLNKITPREVYTKVMDTLAEC
jgi:heptosyltransferase-2